MNIIKLALTIPLALIIMALLLIMCFSIDLVAYLKGGRDCVYYSSNIF